MSYKTGSITVAVPNSTTKEDKYLHGQIEDLLTAMSEMQRDHAVLVAQLQREREERSDDHRTFRRLVQHVKLNPSRAAVADRRRTAPIPVVEVGLETASGDPLTNIIAEADVRLAQTGPERSSMVFETKKRLRDSLTRSKDLLQVETSRSQDLSRQLDEQEKETASVKEQLREARNRIREGLEEKQKLEKTITELRSRTPTNTSSNALERPILWRSETADARTSVSSLDGGSSGLKELRLGRPNVGASSGGLIPPQQSLPKRTSSLATQSILSTEDHAPAGEDDLLVELVNAKTSEATARQELEELKGRFEALKKMLGPASPSFSVASPGAEEPRGFGLNAVVPRIVTAGGENKLAATPGFWGWGRRSFSTTGTPEKA